METMKEDWLDQIHSLVYEKVVSVCASKGRANTAKTAKKKKEAEVVQKSTPPVDGVSYELSNDDVSVRAPKVYAKPKTMKESKVSVDEATTESDDDDEASLPDITVKPRGTDSNGENTSDGEESLDEEHVTTKEHAPKRTTRSTGKTAPKKAHSSLKKSNSVAKTAPKKPASRVKANKPTRAPKKDSPIVVAELGRIDCLTKTEAYKELAAMFADCDTQKEKVQIMQAYVEKFNMRTAIALAKQAGCVLAPAGNDPSKLVVAFSRYRRR